MRKVPSLWFLALALGAVGCGDTPQAVIRDIITFKNELADEALHVTDEASAKATQEGRLKKMRDRQERIKKRLDEVKEDRRKLGELFQAAEYYKDEMEASDQYLARAAAWLGNVGGSSAAQEITSLASISLPPQPVPKQNNPPGVPGGTGGPGVPGG